ncbi:MAG: CRISPR-associated protein Cas4 [Eubacteriales bacterium]|nr:CRISPR-associated protein Cas4 [Eubacteriales bacterium]
MASDEDDYLQLSGLQHYAYCPRQWALITLEGQWAENLRTIEGQLVHERAHDENLREKRGDLLVVRGLAIRSRELGVSGQCDVVEFKRDPAGVALDGQSGLWLPTPVEYKRGQPKTHDADRLQLCCQALCLEEMLLCPTIETAYLYYAEPARREKVDLTDELRDTVRTCLRDMHRLASNGHTPKAKPTKGCNACSLRELCLPSLTRRPSASAYIAARLREEEESAQA